MPEQIKNPVQMFCSDSDRIDRLVSFLTYCGIDAQKAYDEEDDSYALLVDSSDRRRASHLMQDFLEKEKERALAEQKKNEDRQPVPYSHVYEKCEDRYKNHLSSAITCAVVGTGLLASLCLSQTELIAFPGTFQSNTFSFTVFLLVAVFFEVFAALSFHRAGDLKQQIADEEDLTESLTNWFITTYDQHQLDSCISAAEGDIEEEEVLYLKRLECISSYLTRENEHLDAAYVAKLAEDLYALIYDV